MSKAQLVLDRATKTHEVNDNWVTFFREVLGCNGIMYQMFPTVELRDKFEQTDEYQEIVKMLFDLMDKWVQDPNEEVKQITLRVPKSVHDWLQDCASTDGYTTLNKFLIQRLFTGCLMEFEHGRQTTSKTRARIAPDGGFLPTTGCDWGHKSSR